MTAAVAAKRDATKSRNVALSELINATENAEHWAQLQEDAVKAALSAGVRQADVAAVIGINRQTVVRKYRGRSRRAAA